MNATGESLIRLLLVVDYQHSVRRGLRMRLALDEDLDVVGEARTPAEAIPLAHALRPDVILLDVGTQGAGAGAATEKLRDASPRSAMVVFTLGHDAATSERALAAGAAEFVAKHQTEETLLAAIRAVASERRRRSRA